MRKELYLVVALAFLLILSACTANQDEEPQIGQSSAQSSVDEMDDSMESSSDEMEEQTETKDSADKVEMAEDQPAMKESDQEDSASESNQMTDDEHPEVEEMEQAETSEEANTEESGAQAPGVDLPAWQQLPITNARTGDSFTLADFAGKTVFVEPKWLPGAVTAAGSSPMFGKRENSSLATMSFSSH